MKKVLSLLLALIILSSGLIQCLASAKTPNYAAPLYKYNGRVYSSAFELIDMDDPNFQVLAGKNINKRKYPASLTKIVTAMVVLKNTKNLKKKTTVKASTIRTLNNTGAKVANLKAGQKVTIEQLLNLTLVYSACDASRVLADAVCGNNKAFVKKMNSWVRSLGCKNTHFVNADGLHSSKHYTTVADLRLVMKEACKNKTFLKIACKNSYVFKKHKYIHTNNMLNKSRKYEYYKFARGIKTGYTYQAKRCVITFAKNGSKKYLAICLNAPMVTVNKHIINGSFADAKSLFNWSYKKFKMKNIVTAKQSYTKISVKNGDNANKVTLCFKNSAKKLIYGKFDKKKLTIKPIKMPKSIKAPVKAGQKICNAKIYYNGYYVKTVPLVANKSIKKSKPPETEPTTTITTTVQDESTITSIKNEY